ncbi:PH domain-containing protein [Arenimonas sp.]|uniref:PH domain-containing protein n=1 Tax=Arenimonas sp. TaxID=1872635 RepID=UPI0039E61F31
MSDASDTPPERGWRAFPSAALRLAAINGFLLGLLVGSGASAALVFRQASQRSLVNVALALSGLLLLAALLGWLNRRRWQAAAWKLDEAGLQVRRGRLWRKEILIPRSRVQHLDIERGPIERRFGLATLTVHTAGTRLQALRQPGLRDEDAVALRDALIPASNTRDDVV